LTGPRRDCAAFRTVACADRRLLSRQLQGRLQKLTAALHRIRNHASRIYPAVEDCLAYKAQVKVLEEDMSDSADIRYEHMKQCLRIAGL
jgi:hypothetical protein